MTDTIFTCDQLDALLPDYLEGTLAGTDRAAVEGHARGCARCGALLADLAAIAHDAAGLPDLAPSRDLWAGIAERIEAPVIPLAPAPMAGRGARRRWSGPWLAAAAALLVSLSTGITFLATRHHYAPASTTVAVAPSGAAPAPVAPATAPHARDSLTRPVPRAASPAASPSFASRRAAPVDRVYDAEISRLAAILRERRSQLDPATVAIVEKNLRIIDQAIAQSRAALSKDPASHLLNDQLNSALDQKVELLRTVALLPSRT